MTTIYAILYLVTLILFLCSIIFKWGEITSVVLLLLSAMFRIEGLLQQMKEDLEELDSRIKKLEIKL